MQADVCGSQFAATIVPPGEVPVGPVNREQEMHSFKPEKAGLVG